MSNPNIANPELEMQMHGLNPGDIATMNPEELRVMGIPEQFAALDQDAVTQSWPSETAIDAVDETRVENRAEHGFDIQAGVDNQLFDSEGRQLSKTKGTEDSLALRVEDLNGNEIDKGRTERVAKSMRTLTELVLKQYGAEASNVGEGGQAQQEALLADATKAMYEAGGAKELDPTRSEQLDPLTNQVIGLEAVMYYDKNTSQLGELYKDDPNKALEVAKAVSLYRQNGEVNHLTTQNVGAELQKGSEFTLAA